MSTQSLKESTLHTSLVSPFRYYLSVLPDRTPFFPPHWHNEFEINYIKSGRALFIYQGKSYSAQKGDIFVFLPNQVHSMAPFPSQSVYYDTFLFSAEAFGSSNERGNHTAIAPLIAGNTIVSIPICADSTGYMELRNTIEALMSAAKQGNPLSDLLIKSALCKFFYYLYISGNVSVISASKSYVDERIQSTIAYIYEHYAEKLTVDQLAQEATLSKSYFMSCFKQATGSTIISYITQARISKACEMLIHSDKQIVQIALDCGFSNLSNFNRQFKKGVGCAPTQYKKHMSCTPVEKVIPTE